MNTNRLEIPICDETYATSAGGMKKYYTADEAIAFVEPRIRAMFR